MDSTEQVERPENDVYKIVLMGDKSVGKTQIKERYHKGAMSKIASPTIGVEFCAQMVTLSNKEQIRVHIWDLAGQERYRSIIIAHFKKSSGALLCFDLTKESSFDNLKYWLDEYRKQSLTDGVIILVGNKSDLIENNPQMRKIDTAVAQAFANQEKMLYFETSAATGTNIEQAFQTLIEEIWILQQKINDAEQKLEAKRKEEASNKECQ